MPWFIEFGEFFPWFFGKKTLCYAYRTSLLLFILLSRTRKCVHQEQSLKSLFFQLTPVSSRLKRDLLLRCCSGTTSLQYSCVCRSIQFKLWKRYKVWEYIIISLCKLEPVLDIIRIQLISASSTELTWFTRWWSTDIRTEEPSEETINGVRQKKIQQNQVKFAISLASFFVSVSQRRVSSLPVTPHGNSPKEGLFHSILIVPFV